MKPVSFILDNGLRVLIYPHSHFEGVCVVVGVRVGTIDDGKALGGLTHYLEHMMFRGTRKRTSTKLREDERAIGADDNAFTDLEVTEYYVSGHSRHFEKIVEIMSDMISHSTIPPKEFELERGPIINERRIRQDNTRYFPYDNFTSVLFKGNPAGTVKETEESIKRISRKDVVRFYNNYYSPENMILTMYGNVGLSEARGFAKKYFGSFKKKHQSTVRKIAAEPNKRRDEVVHKKNLKNAVVIVGFKCNEYSKRHEKEYLALSVIERILFERLWKEIRDKRGLSYDPSVSYTAWSTFGYLACTAGTEPKKVEKVRQLMLDEMKKLKAGKVTRKEVDRAKRTLSTQYRMLRDDLINMAYTVTTFAITTGDYMFAQKLPERIEKLSFGDIVKTCKATIDVENYQSLVLKPKR